MSKHCQAQFTLMVTATAFGVSISWAQNVPREIAMALSGQSRTTTGAMLTIRVGSSGYSVVGAPTLVVCRCDATATRHTVKA